METKILNLIDFEKVDTLLEGFNKSTGFVTAILDLDGNVLSKSGWRQICTEFHRINTETSKKCTISDTVLAGQLAAGEKYHFYKCLNGLVDVAVPVVIKGEHIANLFSGQFFFEEPDKSFFMKQAKKYGFDQVNYLEALEKVPVVSEEKVKSAMDFLLNMTQLISEMTLQKLEQILLNEELRTSEERYRLVLENSMDAILLTSPDGIIFSANHAACTIFQRTEEEICSLGRNGIIDVADPRLPALLEERNRTGKAKGEIFMLRSDGSRFPVELSTSVFTDHDGMVRTSMIIRDITERKQTESALRESEERFRKSFEEAPMGIAMANLTTGRLFSTNNSLCEMLGYSNLELQQLTFIDVTYPDDRFVDKQAIKDLTAGRIQKHVTEKRYIRKDGKIIWGLRALTKISVDDGKPEYALAIIKDITDRKIVEEEIKKLNANLEFKVELRTAQLETMNKELEAFSYSVSHDLRAPLRHINGFVSILNNKYRSELPEKAIHYFDTISGAVEQMGILIDDLLQFSRTGRQEVNQTVTNMNVLIKEVLEKIKPDTETRKINWSIQQLPEVFGDYSLLKQVWFNLIDNAIKYTRNEKQADISIGYTDNQHNIVFFIRDNGVGFDMKYSHKLFGVFQRLHSQAEFEGTGIGLANVQRIIHKHNGKVWAEAKPNVGATFFFSIPNIFPFTNPTTFDRH